MKIQSGALLVVVAVTALNTYHVNGFNVPNSHKNERQVKTSLKVFNNKLSRTIVNPIPTIPIIEDWNILDTGEVIGTVIGHAVFDDGTTITTSPLSEDVIVDTEEGHVVCTQSGSKYKLGSKVSPSSSSSSNNQEQQKEKDSGNSKEWSYDFFKSLFTPPAAASNNGKKKNGFKPPSMISAADSILFRANGISAISVKKSNNNNGSANGAAVAANGTKNGKTLFPKISKNNERKNDISYDPATLEKKKREATKKYNLTGQTIANGKYLLSGKAQASTSGKSTIWTAYRADETTGLPAVFLNDDDNNDDDDNSSLDVVTIKLTDNSQAIRRESRNYKRVKSGLFKGLFVEKIEFLSDIEVMGEAETNTKQKGGSNKETLQGKSALVLERGMMDLQEYMTQRDRVGLSGRAMRDAAHAAGKCIQAVHSSNLVWTDLKTDNFVVMNDGKGGAEEPFIIKGIDLESAMPLRSNPVDYSPQACPPEFADAYVSGRGHDFILDASYDMWSLGMMLYELSTGFHYFAGETPLRITKALKNDFRADVSAVKDNKLRDLIEQCLRDDPKKRPTITQFLFHPYFLTSGIGAHSF